uniref:Oleosin n=1 Tax=Paeonia ostii TaxID=459177 RepID=A0A2P1AF46_9MAGN|nr:oleosin 17.5 kDa protein [Paeonia ostii]
MSDRSHTHQLQVHPQLYDPTGKSLHHSTQKGPSTSQVLAVVTLLPVGGILLALSGLTLAGTVLGLALATPVFILFSPVLVPAAIAIGLAVMAFLASGAFGLTALSSLSWIVNVLRNATAAVPNQLEEAKKRMADLAGYTGQKTKDVGQTIQNKAQESGRTQAYEAGKT